MLSKQQILHAKKKLTLFMQREIERSLKNVYIARILSDIEMGFALPTELLTEMMQHLTPRELLLFGSTCRHWYFLHRSPKLWTRHILDFLGPLEIRSSLIYSKETYSLLHGLSSLSEASSLLDLLENDCVFRAHALLYKQQIEEIFEVHLKIPSPWSTRRFDNDLVNFPSTQNRLFCRNSLNSLSLVLYINDGFYKDLRPQFNIFLGDDSLVTPPVVKLLSTDVSHPLINEKSGLVELSLFERWKPEEHTLKDVIVEVERLFVDPKFLTECFVW